MTPAATAPATAESAKSRRSLSTPKRVRHPATMTPVKAPTLMKPACPSDSSPDTPTTRFSDTASDTYAQMGTSWPESECEMSPSRRAPSRR